MSDREYVLYFGVIPSAIAFAVLWLRQRRHAPRPHSWEVVHAFRVTDHRGRDKGWRGERRCRNCPAYEVIIEPVATREDLEK